MQLKPKTTNSVTGKEVIPTRSKSLQKEKGTKKIRSRRMKSTNYGEKAKKMGTQFQSPYDLAMMATRGVSRLSFID